MKLSLSFYLLLLSISIFAQDSLEVEWIIQKEGPQMLGDFAWTLDLDENDNIYWATTESINNTDIKDIFVYKLNPDGEELWDAPVQYGGQFEQQAYISTYKDGIYYVAGRDFHNFDLPPAINLSLIHI